MKDMERYALLIVIGYIVLWYVGVSLFPLLGDSLNVGFTGLLIVIVIVICTCWIIDTIQKKDK